MGSGAALRRLWPWASAAAAGAALSLAYPRWNVEAAAWLWPIPLLAALWFSPSRSAGRRRRLGRAAALGYVAGFVFFTINVSWLAHIKEAPPAGRLALPPLLALYLALFPAAWGMVAATIGRPRLEEIFRGPRPPSIVRASLENLRAAAVSAAAWVALEWLRGVLFTGFGWNGLGVGFWQNLTLIQIADITGVTGLSFLPIFLASVGVGIARRIHLEFAERRVRPHIDFAAAVLLLLGVFFYGLPKVSDPPDDDETVPVRVLLVQLNVPLEEKWSPEHAERIYARHRDLTDAYVSVSEFDLVIWPESALPIQLHDPANVPYFRHVLGLGDFALLLGINENAFGEGIFNSAALMYQNPETRRVYRKIHLVPFGEYLPLRKAFPPFEWIAGDLVPGDFDAGDSTDPLPMPNRPVSLIPAICFEDTIGRLLRKFVREEPQMIVNVTNDGWFRESAAAEQHLANAVFRCVELRRPMARAANTGVSGVIDEIGSLRDRRAGDGFRRIVSDPVTGSIFIEDALPATIHVPANPPITFYARFGDLFSLTMAAIAAAAIAARIFRRRKSGEAPRPEQTP